MTPIKGHCLSTSLSSLVICICFYLYFYLIKKRKKFEDYPKFVLPDEGSQLVGCCEKMVLNMTDIKGILNRGFGVQFELSTVGGHNLHEKVERKIHTARYLRWNGKPCVLRLQINNLSIAIGIDVDGLEHLDLITPNRLTL